MAIALTAVGAMGGCVRGSLASSTGSRPPGFRWSDASRQMAHVGEEVQFDFILLDLLRRPVAAADYCVAITDGRRIEAAPDRHGRFQFTCTFDNVRPADRVKVLATAYLERGGRDFMKIGGQWLQSDSPYEEPDRPIASDSIVFTIYQAPVELRIARPLDPLDPQTGVMRIHRADGTTTSVYIDKPNRPGFTINGPNPDGSYHVYYQPSGDELNPIETTEVDFTIYDVSGRPHHASTTLDTP